MRIAQVAPLHESCPPRLYGGTERIVSYLTEELVLQGHDVTLFASGDSETRARLDAPCKEALRLSGCVDPLAFHLIMLNRVARLADRFDIIHFHTDYLHFPIFADRGLATLTTMHGRLDLPELSAVFAEFAQLPLASISMAQRAPARWAHWVGTVYHGLPLDRFEEGSGSGGYLAFLGRFSPEKGAERAIEIARGSGIPIKLAAKIDAKDRPYFEAVLRPLLSQPDVEYVGEIGEAEKQDFLGNASALLFPIDWPEPFGLVMIEAFAVGTPVLAFPCGSVPEIVEDGRSGVVVQDVAEAVRRMPELLALDRNRIRGSFEERFSVERMAADYLALYRKVMNAARSTLVPPQEPDLESAG
jgi:glycosyltransferase involved in cell wall biosynthesis